MITSIGRVLRLVLDDSGTPPEADPSHPTVQDVELSAYADDCRVFGRIRLDAERLSDMLNIHDQLQLVDVRVESLADGTTQVLDEISVGRDELLVVEINGPRGNRDRRMHTTAHPVVASLGPYEVRGYVHVTPGADPLNAIRRRRPLVPLTEASIRYSSNGQLVIRRAGTLVFNRETADWIALADSHAVDSPESALGGRMLPEGKAAEKVPLAYQDL